MNTSFERSANASDEWYTPREIIEALGEFDLDPCAPMHPLWPTAKTMYNKQDNGLINRCDSNKFQDIIFTKATGMMFLRNRIKFFRPDGTRGDSPGCGSVLIAFGRENAEILRNCSLQGKYVELNNDK
ncbi:adenine methyltransferase [Phocaeicola vulgatus]|uniref:adenine methyltransferase n=1 Tax=Phocaeicola vulgatus TaxID=821 RepID=UPI0018980C13|nr:adenine methyltransferase [Phocaeicola vulgatus]MDB1083586.1 adenine methyltransferase [Phocaeicola vulgatus]MDB1092307.1 adenine methyltransferase [Phocaeicola vulgatus]